MKKTKIYNVLSHFNKYEQNRLRKFLQSPYFNSDENIASLFDLIVKHQNKKSKKELYKENLWKELTDRKAYDDTRLRKYCSDLLKLVESFLAIENIENNKITKSHLTLDAIKNRKIEHLYDSFTRTSKRNSEKSIDSSANYHLNQYLIEKNLYEINQSDLKRLNKSNIEAISTQLDKFYFSEKLRFYSAALSQQGYLKEAYEIDFMKEIVEIVENSTLLKHPSVSIYYYSLLTIIESENVQHYYDLKKALYANAKFFPKNEALALYYFAANYCIRKHNQNDRQFSEEIFNNYNEMVESEIILSDQDEISPWDFKNIVTIGLFLKKYHWTEKFIHKFGGKIPFEYRTNSIKYNLGQLYFWQKKYDQVLEQLRDFEHEDVLSSLNAKTYVTRTYYELDEINLMYSFIESFRVYLGRKLKKKEISKDRQQPYIRFLNLMRKLGKIFPKDHKAIEKFEQELDIQKKQGLAGAKWLTEKIEELK